MLGQIVAITRKELAILERDPGGLALLFVMPAMFILLMTLALGGLYASGNKPIALLVANEDRGPLGAQIVEALKSVDGVQIETEWQGTPLTRARAEALIAAGDRNIAVILPLDLTETIQAITSGGTAGAGLARPRIELIADPAVSAQVLGPIRGAVSGLSQQAAMTSVVAPSGVDLMVDQLGRRGVAVPDDVRDQFRAQAGQLGTGGLAGSLITIADTAPSGMQAVARPNVVQQNVPGYALFGVFFIAQVVALSFLEERRLGTLRRLRAVPVATTTLLLGKLLPFFMVNLLQIVTMFAIGIVVMPLLGAPRLELGPHPEALVLISIAAALAATSLGVLLASVATTPAQAGGLSALLVVMMGALGGVMVPRYIMPPFMQRLGLLTPHAWALDGYLNVLVRGQGIPGIMPQVAALLAFAVVFLAVAIRRLKWV